MGMGPGRGVKSRVHPSLVDRVLNGHPFSSVSSVTFPLGGREVVAFDSMEFGHWAAVGDVPLVKGDVAGPESVAQTVERFVLTLSSNSRPTSRQGTRCSSHSGTSVTTRQAAPRSSRCWHGAGVGRMVFSSTCAVCGTPERVPEGEDAPVHPESPYGESKAMTERVLGWYDRCLGLRSVRLRYFNAAGAWPDGSIGEDWTVTINLIPLLMKAALGRRGPLEVFGTDYPTPDGTAIRDDVHVVDLAEAHMKALEYLEGGGETTVLNLGRRGRGTRHTATGKATETCRGPEDGRQLRRRPAPCSGPSVAGGVVPSGFEAEEEPEPGSGGLQVARGVLAEGGHQLVEGLVEFPLVVGGAHVLEHGA